MCLILFNSIFYTHLTMKLLFHVTPINIPHLRDVNKIICHIYSGLRAKEHWIWNQDLLPLVLDLLLTHGSPWADTALKLSLHGEAGEMICIFSLLQI